MTENEYKVQLVKVATKRALLHGRGPGGAVMELKDLNSPSLNETSPPPMPCCVRLCCKSMTYRADERPGLLALQRHATLLVQHHDGPAGAG